MTKELGLVKSLIQTVKCTKGLGQIVKEMDREYVHTQMETFTKEDGKMANQMEKVRCLIKKGWRSKEIILVRI